MEKNANIQKKCSFIGHRAVADRAKVASIVKAQLVSLIETKGVNTFLFGSRSEFDDICHEVVTELREHYPGIERIAYTCKSEWACMENEREEHERGFSKLMHKAVSLKGYESEVEFDKKNTAGRASYIERNQAMIDDSDYCIFYFNEGYSPHGSTRSGTKIAFNYAMRKAKAQPQKITIINIYQKDEEC